jgi:hypothetical protein
LTLLEIFLKKIPLKLFIFHKKIEKYAYIEENFQILMP